jgi:predicted NAD/FAD-binding protein
MPVRRSAWSAWNFLTESLDDEQDKDGVTLTYWMNLLQSLSEEKYGPILVTLNAPPGAAARDQVVAEFDYDHPIYTAKSVAAQKTLSTLQGWKGCRFAGAWSNYSRVVSERLTIWEQCCPLRSSQQREACHHLQKSAIGRLWPSKRCDFRSPHSLPCSLLPSILHSSCSWRHSSMQSSS